MKNIMTLLRRQRAVTPVSEEPDQITDKDAIRTKQNEIAARLQALEIETDLLTHHITKD